MMHVEAQQMDQLKVLLARWAAWGQDRLQAYPRQSAFVTERVDGMNRDTDTLREAPEGVIEADREIMRLAPGFRAILVMQYKDKRPQKQKAAALGMSRESYCRQLSWTHEHLQYVLFNIACDHNLVVETL